jgi:hypothetical protein
MAARCKRGEERRGEERMRERKAGEGERERRDFNADEL